MATLNRHEATRGAWLLNKRSSMASRRIATKLLQEASEHEDRESGATVSAQHLAKIPSAWEHFVQKGEDSKEKTARGCFLVLLVAPIYMLFIGPVLGVSYLLYRAWTDYELVRGRRPRRWPPPAVGGVMAVLGLLALKAFPSLVTVATIYDGPVIDVHWVRLVGVTVWWLLAISAAAVSWQIDRYGWAGVKDVDITPVGEHAERQQATREQTYALPTGDGSWEEKYAGSVENDEVPDELLELAAADDQPETFDDQPSDDQSTPIFTLPSGDYTTSKE